MVGISLLLPTIQGGKLPVANAAGRFASSEFSVCGLTGTSAVAGGAGFTSGSGEVGAAMLRFVGGTLLLGGVTPGIDCSTFVSSGGLPDAFGRESFGEDSFGDGSLSKTGFLVSVFSVFLVSFCFGSVEAIVSFDLVPTARVNATKPTTAKSDPAIKIVASVSHCRRFASCWLGRTRLLIDDGVVLVMDAGVWE